jgi:parallel beta-helix repeat protein
MSRITLLLLSIVHLTIFSSPSSASELVYKPDELIVRFAPKTDGSQRTLSERNEVLASINCGTVKRSCKLVPGLTLVNLPENLSVEDALLKFKNASGVLYAERNYRISLESKEPNDPYYEAGNLWGMLKIDANDAWDIHTGSSEIIVAVIDGGVDYDHNDLADNMWINTGEIPDNYIDDDNNGYVDDIYGYDFCTYGQSRDSDPNDEQGHGTQCAGIIGAVGDNNEGVTGVCWNVKIMALRFINSSGFGWSYDAIDSISYAVQMGANVLSNSWGYEEGSSRLVDIDALRNAIEAADANGVLFVASAGNINKDNDKYDHYPSNYELDNIIAVMATDQYDERSTWPGKASHYGATSVDLAAPGSYIYSCDLGGGYKSDSGTSMAAAHVSGACALVWSVNPWLSHWDVKRIILETVDVKSWLENDLTLGRLCLTGGRLNVYNAVIEAGQLALTKVDDVNYGELVLPNDNITYTIDYGNPVTDDNSPIFIGTVNDVTIVDNLPNEVDFVSATGSNSYDSNSHTVTWQIGTLSEGQTDSVTLTVKVNELAEPLGSITNVCDINGTGIRPTTATATVDVNCWTPDVIYVDANATGSGTGMSWDNAYTDLQDALERAAACYVPQIWVAKGTYRPDTNPSNYDANFSMIDDVALYGGFNGTETSRSQRNLLTNETILTGDIDGGGADVGVVVSANSVGETTIINGFTIMKGEYYGIRCNNASPTIKNNEIKDNDYGLYCRNNSEAKILQCEILNNDFYEMYCDDSNLTIIDCNINGSANSNYGIYCKNNSSIIVIGSKIQNSNLDGINCDSSDVMVSNCIIQNNNDDGVYIEDSTSAIITNSVIRGNGGYGIYYYLIDVNTTVEIKNAWIYKNDSGIYIAYVDEQTLIRNNTIFSNTTYGIHLESAGPSPEIRNCIIWDNGTNLYEDYGYFTDVKYSCIQGDWPGTGNIDPASPGFVNADANNYHLDPNVSSPPCIDTGDPSFADPNSTETDIDGETRISDGDDNGTEIVDMGADEFYWSLADFDRNKIVNFVDFALFASAWQTDDPNYSLDDNNDVDTNDLDLFCEDWLWKAAWTEAEPFKTMGCGMGEGMSQSIGFSEDLEPTPPAEQPVTEPVDIEALIEQLEQIWETDEQIRELISEDDWQRFMESLKEEL